MKLRSLAILMVSCVVMSAALAWQSDDSQPESAEELLAVLRQEQPKFWKGNLHTHSLWSDGNDFPEMIADWYKRHGYNFLAMTDHNVLSEGQRWIDSAKHKVAMEKYLKRFGPAWVEQREFKEKPQVRLKPLAEFRTLLDMPGRFLMVQGEEITHRFARSPVHMNAVNLRDVITPISGDSVTETIRVNHRQLLEQANKRKQKMLVFLNHPNFGWGIRAEDLILAEELRYFEVYNGHPGVRNYGDEKHVGTERMWDIVNALRLGKHKLPIVYGMATDDAHRYHVFGPGKVNPGRGWVMVRSPFLTGESLVTAMEKGDFYCSTGVTLQDVRRDGDTLSIKIQAEPGVKYTTQFIATFKDAPLTSEPYVVESEPKDEKHVKEKSKDGDSKQDAKSKTDAKDKKKAKNKADLKDKKDAPSKKVEILEVTRIYSKDVGKVILETTSLEPVYRFSGDELYVRAKIISTRAHPNPYAEGDVEMAWTQPQTP